MCSPEFHFADGVLHFDSDWGEGSRGVEMPFLCSLREVPARGSTRGVRSGWGEKFEM